MKGRFQPTTVGNMARDPNGGYVCADDYDAMVAKHAALESAYQKQRETAAAMISHRDGIINGAHARIAKAIHWAEHAMLMYSYQNKELLDILRDEAKTPNGEVRGASRLAGEASSREAATSTVVLGGDNGGDK